MNSKMKYFLLAWSQIGWFGCVYSAKFGLPLVSLVIPAIAWVVLLVSKTLSKTSIVVLLGLSLLGVSFDAILANFEFIRFGQQSDSSGLLGVPIWLISMWLLFVTILPFLAKLFEGKNVLAFFAGFILGPLTYKSGEAFDVLHLNDHFVFLIYAVFWGLYFTSGLYFVRKSYEN